MFNGSDINDPDCRESSLQVEWHDCSWCPPIGPCQGLEFRSGPATKPLPGAAVMPHPVRRKNLVKPMKNIGNRKSEIRNSQFAIRNATAFTLVELLVVIAIIGILAAMILPALAGAKKAAQKMKAKTEIADLVNAINAYDADYSRFPIIKSEQPASGDFTTGLVQYPQAPNTTPQWPPGAGGLYSHDNNNTVDNNSNVVAILMDLQTYPNGVVTSNNAHVYNPKQVKYLNAKMSGYDPSQQQLNPPGGVDNTGVYRDPWGNPYIITMDLSYDEQCSDLYYCQKNVSQDATASNPQTGLNGLFNPTSPGSTDNFLYHGKVMVWSAGPDGKIDNASAGSAPANKGFNKDNVLSWQ